MKKIQKILLISLLSFAAYANSAQDKFITKCSMSLSVSQIGIGKSKAKGTCVSDKKVEDNTDKSSQKDRLVRLCKTPSGKSKISVSAIDSVFMDSMCSCVYDKLKPKMGNSELEQLFSKGYDSFSDSLTEKFWNDDGGAECLAKALEDVGF